MDDQTTPTRPRTDPEPTPALERAKPRIPVWVNAFAAVAFLYLFLCALKIMSAGLKVLTTDPAAQERIHNALSHASNPFIALTAAVLVTAVVQSSSFTTSLIITLVGSGQFDIETGVFMVMGANIGTSVTSTIAALGSLRIQRQFRRAFAAAIVHDFFNLLTVAVLFPLEWGIKAITGAGPVARLAGFAASRLGLPTTGEGADPVKALCAPAIDATEWLVRLVGLGNQAGGLTVAGGIIMACLGVVLLLVSLALMVSNLKGALLTRLEGMFSKVFFRNDAIAYATGCIATILVQSSSITTSLVVPLAGAGTIKLKRVFPFVLGANLGTTVTGLMAAAAVLHPAAVTVGLAHTLFNIIGAAIWYPLRWVPITLAKQYALLAARKKRYALYYLLGVFIVIPGVGLAITEWLV